MHQNIAVVDLDLAKRVFQVHAIGFDGEVIAKRKLRRSEIVPFFSSLSPCLVGMEARASAHHSGRELIELEHEVRLMPPAYVKPYVKRGKTNAGDAEAICEAVTRPTMRFVAVKSREQQGVLMLHKSRDLLVRQRTALINALRSHLAEFGIVSATGPGGMKTLTTLLHEEHGSLPSHARSALFTIVNRLTALAREIERLEKEILEWHRSDANSRRLATIPGIGPITASAIAAAAPDPGQFKSGRQFAAWLGLTPRAYNSRGVKSAWVVSASRETGISDDCLWSGRHLSFEWFVRTRAANHGWRSCSNGKPLGSRQSVLPTRPPEVLGLS